MSDREERIRAHSGAYVDMYERKPISRIARLVPRLRLQPHEDLVDVACGNAMLLPLIHDRVRSYAGVDFSPEFIDVARRRAGEHGISNCTFHCADVVDFCNARKGQFDVATALDFSEHIDDGEFIAIFSAIHASLRAGGRLYLHTPNLEFVLERLKERGILRQFPEHIAVRSAPHLVRQLEQCGLDRGKIAVEVLPHYNVMRLLHPLRHLPVVGRVFAARLFIECRA
jgi:2-polyprenyl-3-methyl-5-hydroxy-6-metoxy-1,4-benzoquinol methylase